jgi:hypothetical protein
LKGCGGLPAYDLRHTKQAAPRASGDAPYLRTGVLNYEVNVSGVQFGLEGKTSLIIRNPDHASIPSFHTWQLDPNCGTG